jgi:hypothetical protein
MKNQFTSNQKASVLITTLMIITILMMICATSLYITSQNTTTTTQTTSWQQALSGAEAGVDVAMNALNTNGWTSWRNVTSSTLPQAQPAATAGSTTNAVPGNGTYNCYTNNYALTGEASNSVTYWVTVDNGTVAPTPSPSPGLTTNGKQGYRIRAFGIVAAPGPARVSNQKLDNDLRKISLVFNRFGSGTIGTPQATRRIEMIAMAPNNWTLQLGKQLTMSGGSYIDSFSSTYNQTNYSSPAYSSSYGDNSNVQVGIVNNTGGSDLGSMAVKGSLSWAGTTAPKNTGGVTGGVTGSYNGTISAAPTPPTGVTWGTSYGGAGGTIQAGANGTTTYLKVNGDVNIAGGQSLYIQQDASGGTQNVVIWITGQFQTSGSGYIKQDASINVTYYVGGQINFSGGSFQNLSGKASNDTIYGIGASGTQANISGSSQFTGVIYAPNYDVKISGSGYYVGSMVANSLDLSGGANMHYDEALAGTNGNNFSFASWFEDNSDSSRGVYY